MVQLEDIENNQLPDIEMNVDLLGRQVDELSGHIDDVVVSVHSTYIHVHVHVFTNTLIDLRVCDCSCFLVLLDGH